MNSFCPKTSHPPSSFRWSLCFSGVKPATPNDTSVIFEALKPDFDFNKNKQRIIGEEAKPAHSLEDTAKVFGVDEDNDFQLGTEY